MPPSNEELKKRVDEACRDLEPFKHIQALDFPRQTGTEGEAKGIDYIKSTFESCGLDPKTQDFVFPAPKVKVQRFILPILVTIWGFASYVNGLVAQPLGLISYILASLVLSVPILIIIGVLKMEVFFKLFLKTSRKRLRLIKQKVEEGTFKKEVLSSQNVWIEYVPPNFENELILTAHHDSVSMKINMNILKYGMIIAAISIMLYSIAYLIGFLLLFFLKINIFLIFWWVFLILLVFFLIFIDLYLIARIFRTDESHGSIDDGTGVAIILELAKVIEKLQPRSKITLVCFGGEEAGLLGSAMFFGEREEYFQTHSVEVISIDMIGEKPPLSIVKGIKPILSVKTDPSLNEKLLDVAKQIGIKIKTDKFPYPGSDFAHWLLSGYKATWLINSSDLLHTKNDKPEKVNQDLLNQCLRLFVGFLLSL